MTDPLAPLEIGPLFTYNANKVHAQALRERNLMAAFLLEQEKEAKERMKTLTSYPDDWYEEANWFAVELLVETVRELLQEGK